MREFGGNDSLTWRAPRSMSQAFPDPHAPVIVCVKAPRRRRLWAYRWPIAAALAVVAVNVLYALCASS